MAGQDIDPDMQNLVSQVAEQCLVTLRQERAQTEQNQLEQINTLLEHWSEQSFQRTKELVNSMTAKSNQNQNSSGSSGGAFADTTSDMRERQANLLAVCTDQKILMEVTSIRFICTVTYDLDCSRITQ